MTRLAVLAVALAAATPSVASAGTYVGLGIGTAVGGSWNDTQGTGDIDGFQRSGRLFGGYRLSKVSFEGQANRFALTFAMPGEYQGTQVAAGVKLSLPLGNNFELFGRAGLARTWVSGRADVMGDWTGNGWFLSPGVEYRLNLGVTSLSLFMDYQRSSTTFAKGTSGEWDGSFGMWTMGASVSL